MTTTTKTPKPQTLSTMKTVTQKAPILSAWLGKTPALAPSLIRHSSFLILNLLLALAFASPTAFAQTTPEEPQTNPQPEQPAATTVDCPGSLLHGRTVKVANAILNAIPGVSDCDQATANHLASITDLNLRDESLTTLQTNDFAGLTNLETLNLQDNQLTSLPDGVFDGLSNLQILYLQNNQLASLPADVFDDLVNLQWLYLYQNQLTNLPAGIFDQLVNLQRLYVYQNQISSLPADIFDHLANLQRLFLYDNRLSSLPPGVFDHLPTVVGLFLYDNQLTNLPSGIFDGLTGMQRLHMQNNQLTSFPDGAFNSVTNLLRLTVYNNQLTNLPNGIFDELVHLDLLDLSRNQLNSFPDGVFDSLTNLEKLWFAENQFDSLPEDMFDQLGNLQVLGLDGNQLTTLPAGIFDQLADLVRLRLENNQLTSLPEDIFDELEDLQELYLSGNQLASLPDGIFDGLTSLVGEVELTGNPLSIQISLSPTALEITEGDQGTTNAQFEIRLSQSPTAEVTVRYATQNNTAISVQDYTATSDTLTFAADDTNLTRTVSIPIIGDIIDELDETFTVILSNPTNAIFAGNTDTLTAIATILDDDGLPTITLSPTRLEVAEGDVGFANANLQVRLSHPSANVVTVRYTTQDGTATSNLDYTTISGTLTFRPGTANLTQTIAIPIRGDTLDEPPSKTFRLILSNPDNAVFAANANTLTATITITDDNPVYRPIPAAVSLPSLIFSANRLSLSEGETAIYQVRGTTLLPTDMIVRLRTSHPQLIVEPQTLVFAPTNWLNFQTVKVSASTNAADISEQAFIRHSIDASEFFLADDNAGAVSISISHTVKAKPDGEDMIEPEPVDPEPEPPTNSEPVDYDQDDDGLIEISNLAQLNAIRFDLNGDGQPDQEAFANAYSQAFPSAIANMGIPNNAPAQGYELTSDLDFDTNHNGHAEEADAFWNKGHGWQSIGLFANPFQAVLAGNGHTIHNLFQDQSDASRFAGKPSGLLGALGNRGQVVGLGLEEVDIKGVNWVGAIAGLSQGVISHCSVSGQVVGSNSVGGLVGHNFGNIAHSFVNAEVSGVVGVSVFVGWNVGGSIESSSAQGRVNGATSAGDLVGLGTPAR